MIRNNIVRYLLVMAGLAVIYHLAARLGLQMAYVQQNTSPVWPPSGIGLAALLLFGIRYWPGITLGVVLGSILTGAPVGLALGLGAANTLEALLGTYLLQRWVRFHLTLDRIKDVVGLALAAAASTAVSATVGVSTLFLSGNVSQTPFLTLWTTWWIGNLLGMLVVAPFLLVWAKNLSKRWKRSQILELVIFLILLILVTGFVFTGPSGIGALHQALIYVIFPFAIWAALRLGQIGAVTTIFIVSGISIWSTVHELGPFSQLPLNESLVLLQTFTGVVSLTTLTLASSASERQEADKALRQQINDNAWLLEQVRLGNEQLHALSHRLMEVQEEERRNLSRELHDETGQILSALMVRLGLLERDAEVPDQIRMHVAELKAIVSEILDNLHNLAVKLRPASLDRLGLVTALQQYLVEYGRQYHLDVQFELVGVEPSTRLPGEIETALFRIIQESLTNVAVHAQASHVDVLLSQRSDCLVMMIEDDGIGFNPVPLANETRLGLFGMRERVEMLGGKLIIESSPGKGTTISVEVPYANSSARSG